MLSSLIFGKVFACVVRSSIKVVVDLMFIGFKGFLCCVDGWILLRAIPGRKY